MLEDYGYGNCGYVAIVGRPNAGKSTFVNQALGYKLAAVSRVPHTTRRRWVGIFTDDDAQIIFSDTPGIHESKNRMDEMMDRTIKRAIDKNDITLLLCDPMREFGMEDEMAAKAAAAGGKPTILVLNKCDKASAEEKREMESNYSAHFSEKPKIHHMSALNNEGVNELLELIKELLPKGPFLYPDDQIADAFLRDIGEDIIRESALELLHSELPHSLAVMIDKWDEREKKIKIEATVLVERESQKQIVIGSGGKMVQEIQRQSRSKLGKSFEKFVDLRLFVKVMPDWQNRIGLLKEMNLNDK
ncbi:GTP-binding protein Era [Lentisphaera araneosa HTCC2155]|uniref:GTPase Era n=1 Tax=Lentisphaera araneosa HTCC2155 TaxID=313628 RepID=A6DJC0_9BACT|nr:GTPase Era [Lentisphaera araneosa]EDM28556.1 GTP-binding protein Era [Lentisphaera araneosa HTCC2155]